MLTQNSAEDSSQETKELGAGLGCVIPTSEISISSLSSIVSTVREPWLMKWYKPGSGCTRIFSGEGRREGETVWGRNSGGEHTAVGCIGDITGKNRTSPCRIASAILELCPERHWDNLSNNIDCTSLCCAESYRDFSVPFMFSSMD